MRKVSEWAAEITAKVVELETQVMKNKTDEKSVGRLKRQARALRVVLDIMEHNVEGDVVMSPEAEDDLRAMISPKKGKSTVVVHEGDSLLILATSVYANVPDVMAKINRAADKAGLILDGSTGLYIRK